MNMDTKTCFFYLSPRCTRDRRSSLWMVPISPKSMSDHPELPSHAPCCSSCLADVRLFRVDPGTRGNERRVRRNEMTLSDRAAFLKAIPWSLYMLHEQEEV